MPSPRMRQEDLQRLSYRIAQHNVPPAPTARTVGTSQEGWRLERPSAFGDQPTMPSSSSPRLGLGRQNKPVRFITSHNGLVATATSELGVFGSIRAKTPAHIPWPGKDIEMDDWTLRPGFGRVPNYLKQLQYPSKLAPATLQSALPTASSTSARSQSQQWVPSTSVKWGSSSTRLDVACHALTSEGYSTDTMRLLEHPIRWDRASYRSRSPVANPSPYCCTYGLLRSPPRTGGPGEPMMSSRLGRVAGMHPLSPL